jgi:dTDP-4-dehydrorhamnose 3,5-epimerase
MRVSPQQIAGVEVVRPEAHVDQRGTFVKLFSSTGNTLPVSQVCSSFNRSRGTLRGMHVQLAPHVEHKALWCATGEVFDVLVDIRPEEPTYGHWAALHLTSSAPQLVLVPPYVAHGFQTLADGTTINYLLGGEFVPGSARTLRWDDPTVGIEWPLEVHAISDADRAGAPWPVS